MFLKAYFRKIRKNLFFCLFLCDRLSRMKAAIVRRYGGPEVLHITEVPSPAASHGRILVKVRAIGLNFADVLGRWGVYPGTPRPPFIPGIEFSGDIVSVGSGVESFRGGERVMGYSRQGSHAEFVSVDEGMATVIPDTMSYEEGAGFPVAFMSAYHGLVRLANIRRGERLLVHAAAGGVGTATVQLAKHLGAIVYGTVGSGEKLGIARSQGADVVVNYRSEDFALRIREHTGGYGVDVVMDSVGGRVFRKGWNLLSGMGRYVLYGLSSVAGKGGLNPLRVLRTYADIPPLFPQTLISANKSLLAFNLGTLTGKEQYFREAAGEILGLYRSGALRPFIGRVFRFEEVVEAHRALQTGKTYGKVIMTFGAS